MANAKVPQYLTSYVIEPWPGTFVAKVLAWEFLTAVLLGTIIAALAGKDVAQPRTASA